MFQVSECRWDLINYNHECHHKTVFILSAAGPMMFDGLRTSKEWKQNQFKWLSLWVTEIKPQILILMYLLFNAYRKGCTIVWRLKKKHLIIQHKDFRPSCYQDTEIWGVFQEWWYSGDLFGQWLHACWSLKLNIISFRTA